MDPEFLKYLGSLGVGGAIAGLLLLFYRKDIKHYTEQWKGQSDQLMIVVKENTAAFTRWTSVIEALHRRLSIANEPEDSRRESGEERRIGPSDRRRVIVRDTARDNG